MDAKLTKIVGLKKAAFDAFVEAKELQLRDARLIPTHKVGDEMALTSVILASLRLINEFRKMVLSAVKMGAGQMYVYTEVSFPDFPESRIDGLIIVVSGGTIKDAALCEMKNGNDLLEAEQIERYQEIAKKFSIPRIITVSNQFVSNPTQFPIPIKRTKSVDLYHFSWSYLLTLSHVLLFDNDTNIADPDQVAIMKEVVQYLEHDKSGVCGFNQMHKGWSDTVNRINSGALLKSSDPDVQDSVLSWQQEERDLALILSRNLGVLVDSGIAKHRSDLMARLQEDTKELLGNKQLSSVLRVKGAVSDIKITALFEKRTVEMSVVMKPPSDKTTRGQLGWMKRQFATCSKKAESAFGKVQQELWVGVWAKSARAPERVAANDLDDVYEHIKEKEIKEFRIVLIKDFGKLFASRTKFVETIERMIIDFYSGVIQHLVRWEPSAPQMTQASTEHSALVEETPEPVQEDAPAAEAPRTAPCPLCQGDLILSMLQVGTNICPHCRGAFQAE